MSQPLGSSACPRCSLNRLRTRASTAGYQFWSAAAILCATCWAGTPGHMNSPSFGNDTLGRSIQYIGEGPMRRFQLAFLVVFLLLASTSLFAQRGGHGGGGFHGGFNGSHG